MEQWLWSAIGPSAHEPSHAETRGGGVREYSQWTPGDSWAGGEAESGACCCCFCWERPWRASGGGTLVVDVLTDVMLFSRVFGRLCGSVYPAAASESAAGGR